MTEEQRTQKIAEIREAILMLRAAERIRKEAFELIGKDMKEVRAIEFRRRLFYDSGYNEMQMLHLYSGIEEIEEVLNTKAHYLHDRAGNPDSTIKVIDFDDVRILQVK